MPIPELNPPPSLDKNRLNQIRQAFHRMKGAEIQALIKEEVYPYEKSLQVLQKALVNMNPWQIQEALDDLKSEIKPLQINSPENYSVVQEKLQEIIGSAEPNSVIRLKVNEEVAKEVRADKEGNFLIKMVELDFGDNTLECFNADFVFVDNFSFFLHIKLERHFYFLGRIDPMTQKAFQSDETDFIIRCKNCRNFEYSYSVSENHGYCTLPDCSGKYFFSAEDTGFWVE